MRQNCWEFKKCGRQPEGSRADELGVCPACTDATSDGKNGGAMAGRYCWKIAGTMCGGKVQGTFAAKLESCIQCDFFNRVLEEERDFFKM